MPHLFTPLYRGESARNRQTGGAGLGPAIARRILQAHGGDLTVANRTTGGAGSRRPSRPPGRPPRQPIPSRRPRKDRAVRTMRPCSYWCTA
ncbi:MAG TPA: ATP-binding protein [Chloroflexota bacterium]|nr:ATP-binding protein [Chloroflexota bacterium]